MLQTVIKLKHCIKNNNRIIQNVHAFERTARATLHFYYYLTKGILFVLTSEVSLFNFHNYTSLPFFCNGMDSSDLRVDLQ